MKTLLSLLLALGLTLGVADLSFADGDCAGCADRTATGDAASDADGGKRGRKRGRRGRAFKKFDANGDGALTADEVPSERWARISKADADGDGSVTKAEAKAFAKKHGKRGRRGHRGHRRGRRGGGSS